MKKLPKAAARRHPLEDRAYILILQGRHSAASLARALDVSPVTSMRIVAALRRSGHTIASVGLNGHRYYEVRDSLTPEEIAADPFVRSFGCFREYPPRAQRKPEDADYDQD